MSRIFGSPAVRRARGILVGSSIVLGAGLSLAQEGPRTTAERSGFTATSRHADILEFLQELQALSPLLRVETLCTSTEGRQVPLLVIGDPVPASPADLTGDDRAVVYLQANIHAGEVEGKEAAQMLARDLLLGATGKNYLDRLVILIAPIFNADGNEKISTENRRRQHGPAEGVGERYNGQGLDLNRDGLKLETPEASGLVENVLNRWDPLLFLDSHTHNGSYHQEPVTWVWGLNPNGDRALLEYAETKLLTAINARMKDEYGVLCTLHGDFVNAAEPATGWVPLGPEPRYLSNYVGLRNRFSILNEQYPYVDFETRVRGSYALFLSFLDHLYENRDEMVQLVRDADRRTAERGRNPGEKDVFIVEYGNEPIEEKLTILGYEMEVTQTESGRRRVRPTETKRTYEDVPYLARFTAERAVKWPRGYVVIAPEEAVTKKLLQHGITVEWIVAPVAIEVESFTVTSTRTGRRPYQNHQPLSVEGEYSTGELEVPAGSLFVSTAQPLGPVAASLLEPESGDGLLYWNYFDGALLPLEEGGRKVYPVHRVHVAAELDTVKVALVETAERTDFLAAALARAGENRAQLERALQRIPEEQRRGLEFLIAHMPDQDLRSLDAEFLLENCALAYEARQAAGWGTALDDGVFFNAILPYASVNERRDRWRADFRERFAPLVAEAKTPTEAAAILNNEIFGALGVKYSTKRKKPDQSPLESMETGLASCTGLSILLVDACRSVGVPARFVGTPLWSDGSGNHSWVEVWDDGWHFTGAAEPTGMELDQGWFIDRARTAKRDEPRNAIFAVTWRKTPISFPMVWLPQDRSVSAVNVTERYASSEEPVKEGFARVRFRVIDAGTGERCAAELVVGPERGGKLAEGESKDERFDANDHWTCELPLNENAMVTARLGDRETARYFRVAGDEQLVTLSLPDAEGKGHLSLLDPSMTVELLRRHLARSPAEGSLEEIPVREFGTVALGERAAAQARGILIAHHAERIRAERAEELENRVLELDGKTMPFWYTVYGEKPEGGRSLFISMHGGGSAPRRVNDGQWDNQKKLYRPEEGVYLAPRGPTDTWNLWHQAHIDDFFDRLIEDLIVFEEVNPDRVYIMGYSAGGDGVYQLAPRMADRLAAAAMMAGHPNETKPDGLRNLPFTLHMGGKDGAYDRNQKAREWKELLGELREADPEGYEHWVEIHEDKSHWMDREDAAAVPWMAKFTRNLRPERVVWLQDDVLHERFYWLAVEEPKARERIVVEREGQTIRIVECPGPKVLSIRLDDSMVDLDQEVVVARGELELFRGKVPRTVAVMAKTLAERGDPRGVFCGEVRVEVPED